MKIVTISGPHGAGKDAICEGLTKKFPMLYKVIPCTTRKMREGESEGKPYHFISEENFEGGLQNGEFLFNAQIRSHRSGFKREELQLSEFILIDILPVGARFVRELVRREKIGTSVHVFIHVPSDVRKMRIVNREPSLVNNPEKLQRMMDADPVQSNPRLYMDFDLILPNPNGLLQQTIASLSEFLEVFFSQSA